MKTISEVAFPEINYLMNVGKNCSVKIAKLSVSVGHIIEALGTGFQNLH